jgi:acetyl-CoA C-acetyltransferase
VTLDPRTPVVIGGGQWSNRVDRGAPPVEPVDLIAEALRRAADDTGATNPVLAAADSVWIVQMLSWRYTDPAASVAARLGIQPRDTAMSPVGGNEPQVLVSQACRDIAAGRRDLVLVGGAEAWRSRRSPGGGALGWTTLEDGPTEPARRTGDEAPLNHPAELARKIGLPTQVYPLFEQALRHAAGRTVDDHMQLVGRLWARFSEIAAGNPDAWVQQAMTPDEVVTASPDNRWICWPYTKVMNANNAVEQGAGLIVASAERATALGVPRDRWVFPRAATEAHDHYAVSHRAELDRSPAIGLAGQALFELAGVGVDDVAHVDLYSCFPSAVQVAAAELGLSLDRDLTVTGGLSFAGGPWNNYVSHSLATMLGVLRDDPGAIGLVSANGGYLTKHALALYSTKPPGAGFRWTSAQDAVDSLPRRDVYDGTDSDATVGNVPGHVESWTVAHDRDGNPERAIATVLLDDDRRAWATSTDRDTLTELASGEEHIGRPTKVTPEGALLL